MSSNEKAFPSENCADIEYNWINKGMDLRDYFAAHALQGILACNYSVNTELAKLAYEYAEQMMKAREQKWN